MFTEGDQLYVQLSDSLLNCESLVGKSLGVIVVVFHGNSYLT